MKLPDKLSFRQAVLAVALVATLLATWWASLIDDAGNGRPTPAVLTATPPPIDARSPPTPPAAAAFGRPAWPPGGAELIVGSPPQALANEPAAVPAEPQAPPLPFRFIGALDGPGQHSVVLLNGKDVITVRAGERIDDQYRVARITPTRIEFIHLPTRQRQALETTDYDMQK